ncbi:GGDEF domain-containing protein, partial [Vibrio sp. 378]|uniref:GGDEF domain-containing protein n=1 Tax=Vibrio sp. 378 TaxID=3074603 RepID=UPI00296514F7
VDALLTTSENLVGKLHLVSNFQTIPEDAVRIQPIEKERLSANHSIYYEYNLWSEIKNLTFFEKYSIMVAVFIYVLSTVVLFYVNMHTERRYFKDLAARDPMTGLLNRRGMQAVWRNKMTKKNVALAVFDIDNFKNINDSLGHHIGDKVIQEVSARLKRLLPNQAIIGHLGGDEFGIILPEPENSRMAEVLSDRIISLINQPFDLHHFSKRLACSIGSVRYPEDGQDARILLQNADTAMYEAKDRGRNRLIKFNDQMNKEARMRLWLEIELQKALQ